MNITIHNVAKKANVSVSTASRVLNGGTKGMRSDATQRAERVLKAARELGYHPNPVARRLVMKRTFSIGFVGSELDNPVRSKFIEALRAAAIDKGYHLLVGGIKSGEDTSQILKNMLDQRVEGLILGNVQPKMHKIYKELPAQVFQNIQLTGFGKEKDLPWDHVVIDYAGMTEALISHLIHQHNFKRIVFAAEKYSTHRIQAYQRKMREEGLENFICQWEAGGHSPEDGKKLAIKMIASGPRPEAIVCHNDILASGIMAGLRQAKINVPEDIAVTGLDNIEMAAYLNPTLTTAGVDASELAITLFEMLIERINGEFSGGPRHNRCREKLFFRESCGCTG